MTHQETSAAGAGPAIINIVTFDVPADAMARFLEISKVNSKASLKEPGCAGFDVALPRDQPDAVMLVETYRDQAAYEAHRVTPHFQAFVKGFQALGATRTARVATRYYPE